MADSVANTIATTAVAKLGASLYGRIDTAGDHDWYRINLVAGQTYEFRLHGVGIDELVDPEVRIRDASGNQLALNDDAGSTRWDGGNNFDSYLEFTAATTGSYYIDVGGHGDDETGDFLLTAVQHDPVGMTFTPDEIAWQTTNNYQSWQTGGKSARYAPADGHTVTVSIVNLTPEGQFLARNALATWAEITGLTFVETSAASIFFDDDPAGNVANTSYSVDSTGHNITGSTVKISTGWLSTFGTGLNSYSYETYLHEIGHALGLGHGGDYSSDPVTYAADAYYRNDSVAYSIMSYMQAFGDDFDASKGGSQTNPNVNADFRRMLTPAIADMIAMRQLYGFTPTVRAGNTTYGYNSNTGNAGMDAAVTIGADMFMTIVDAGGNDTLDFSGTSMDQVISLEAEEGSDVLGGTANLWIARGTQIENAKGGSGIDIIIGNAADNTIDGGGGTDEMWGGAGDDTYWVDNARDIVEEFAGNGAHDRINTTLTSYTLLGDVEELNYVGPNTLAFTGNGNELNNLIIGWSGNDTLDGKAGADVMQGLSGDDTYWVDNVGDVVQEFAGGGSADYVNTTLSAYTLPDNVEIVNYIGPSTQRFVGTGNALANTVLGWGGDDILDGKGGADLMRGYAGNDIFYVDNAGDVVDEIAGNGTDTVYASADYTLGAGVSVEVLRANAGANGLTLAGNEIGNRVIGGAGADLLQGRAGADRLTGGGGADKLIGGGGADRFVYLSLSDSALAARDQILDFTQGLDRIDLSAIDANTTASGPGNEAFTLITGGFTRHAGELSQIIVNGNTAIRGDVDGNGAADFQITLRGAYTLNNADFLA